MPFDEPIVATVVLELLHVPPVAPLLRAEVLPAQVLRLPVIAGIAPTVSVFVM
jgi:hypothetical protein